MRKIALGCLGWVGLLVVGCSAGDSTRQQGLGKNESAIFGGKADLTHDAVVAVLSDNSVCTGTIIAKNGSKGFVLTAAHCLQEAPKYVLIGTDYNDPKSTVFQVTDSKGHPSYQGDNFDFAMVTFVGANASTPTIEPMTAEVDNLKKGSVVEFVGYGRTDGPNGDMNSVRNAVSGTVAQVTSNQIAYEQSKGGPCQGDSGGPSLSTINGKEYVSGVTSYGDGDCTQFGVSGRVSAVYTSFIKPYIDGTSATLTCDECASSSTGPGGSCGAQADACLNDAACSEFAQCVSACSDQACASACVSANQAGASKYNEINTCICNTGCATECATECQGTTTPPACGFSFQEATCGTCADSKCCDAQKACKDDANCSQCVTGQGGTNCDKDPLALAVQQCIFVDQCATECGGGTTPPAGCNPVTNAECKAGEACDLGNDGFVCFPPPNDVKLCGACDAAQGPFCEGGATCAAGQCAKFCCDDGDCGAGNTCSTGVFTDYATLGVCVDSSGTKPACDAPAKAASGGSCFGQGTGGSGGSSGAGGSGGSGQAGSGTAGSGTAGSGTAGSGTAGSGTAGSGTAGSGGEAGSGTAGSDPGEGGASGSGTAGSGTGATSNQGGSGGSGGSGTNSGATAGTSGKGGAGGSSSGSSGSGDAGSGDPAAQPAGTSGDSGGCSTSTSGAPSSGAGLLLGLLGLVGLRRRRAA